MGKCKGANDTRVWQIGKQPARVDLFLLCDPVEFLGFSVVNPHPHSIIQVALPVPLRQLFDYLPAGDMSLDALTPGRRVRVAFGKRQLVGIVVAVQPRSDVDPARLKPLLAVLDDEPAITGPLFRLCQWAAEYYQHSSGEALTTALPALLRTQDESWNPLVVRWQLTQKGRLIGLEQLARAKRQQQALTVLREHPGGLHQPMLAGLGVQSTALAALQDKGLVEQHNDGPPRLHWRRDRILAESPLTLNDEQRHALDAIKGTAGFSVFLLEGVTGSGKTEVYLQAIHHCLQQGRQTLVLVPEIGLTPQTLHRFQQRFAVPVAGFHSSLTDRERLQSWRKLRTGEAAILVGTRSALFTPAESLGLIVVDEEHDLSYKQQEGFRYNARDLAIMRGKLENVPVLLGSATPALETLHAARTGRYQHLVLSQRAGQALMPRFQVMDIRQKTLVHGLAPELLDAVRQTLAAGQQVLVFINRRGFAPVLMCHDCGWFKECPHCDHRMTCHAHPPRLHCHHCDYQCIFPRYCGQCKSTDLRPTGLGTERLEDNLATLFPGFPVIRIDRDTTQRKQALARHLHQIQQGQPCIVVGTQMLAKGHHFPRLTLVLVCDIDSGLFAADFRATEHTAQLLMQVAGRSGRAGEQGAVMLQTRQPAHPLLQTLLASGYGHFATDLLQERRLLGMPPFGYLALLRADSLEPRQASAFLGGLAQWLQTGPGNGEVEVWGPAPALMPRKARRYRFQLMLRASQRGPLQQALKACVSRIGNSTPASVRWSIDVDPVSLD